MKISKFYSRLRDISKMEKQSRQQLREVLNNKGIASEYKLRSIYYSVCRYFDTESPFLFPDLSVNDVSDKLGYNYVYVRKAIRVFKNQSFNAFVNDYRVEYSKALMMSDKTLKMKQVAHRSGYNSPESFSGNFKKREKVSPGTWFERHVGKKN